MHFKLKEILYLSASHREIYKHLKVPATLLGRRPGD